MVVELEEIRLRLSEGRKAHETVLPEQLYAQAFRNYGIALTTLEPADAAARVRRSAIRETLLAFLHDWLYWVSEENRDKLRSMVDLSDDNPWRRAFREALAASGSRTVKALATAPEPAPHPPACLSGLGATFRFGAPPQRAPGS